MQDASQLPPPFPFPCVPPSLHSFHIRRHFLRSFACPVRMCCLHTVTNSPIQPHTHPHTHTHLHRVYLGMYTMRDSVVKDERRARLAWAIKTRDRTKRRLRLREALDCAGSPEDVAGAMLSYNSIELEETEGEVECRGYKVSSKTKYLLCAVEKEVKFRMQKWRQSRVGPTNSRSPFSLPFPSAPLIHCTPRGSLEKQGGTFTCSSCG